MKKHPYWYGILVLLGFVVAFSVRQLDAQEEITINDREAALLAETRAALIGKPMPELDVADWENGEVAINDLGGSFVVIQFWATWCPDCIQLIPFNNQFYADYEDWGLEFIGVCSSDRGQENMSNAVKEWGIKYPVAKDPNLKSMGNYHVKRWPTYVLVDPGGIVQAVEGDIQSIQKKLEVIAKYAE